MTTPQQALRVILALDRLEARIMRSEERDLPLWLEGVCLTTMNTLVPCSNIICLYSFNLKSGRSTYLVEVTSRIRGQLPKGISPAVRHIVDGLFSQGGRKRFIPTLGDNQMYDRISPGCGQGVVDWGGTAGHGAGD